MNNIVNMNIIAVILFIFSSVQLIDSSDYESLLNADNLFGRQIYGPYPVLPPPRSTRQTSGANYICVPALTCILGGNSIDPRILTPGAQVNCPVGQVPCLGAANATCGQRYVNNVNTADGIATLGAYPWQAYIHNQTGYTGSGVLIDSLHVLTAAHKVNLNVNTPNNVRITMGVHDPVTSLITSQQRTAVRIIIHEQFNSDSLKNDIAVVKLSSPFFLGYQVNVGAACLPPPGASFVGQNCWVSGYGKSSFIVNDASTSIQKQVKVLIVSYATCRASMAQPNVLGSNVDIYLDPVGEICAGSQANKDACTQDGGSPLVCLDLATNRFQVAGLAIWGKSCGQPNVYGVFVNVAQYRNWIVQAINNLNLG